MNAINNFGDSPYTYVTTPAFLARWGLDGLQDLPDLETQRDAGLLSKADVLVRTGAPQPPETGPDRMAIRPGACAAADQDRPSRRPARRGTPADPGRSAGPVPDLPRFGPQPEGVVFARVDPVGVAARTGTERQRQDAEEPYQ